MDDTKTGDPYIVATEISLDPSEAHIRRGLGGKECMISS